MSATKLNKKKISFFKSADFIVLAVITCIYFILGFTGVFQKLDYRMYDYMLGLKKEPVESEKILFVNIDNDSIQQIGEWPWSRDVMADCLIRMKELGASGTVFDVEYLSPSSLGVAPKAEASMNQAFSESRDEIHEYVNELSEAVAAGQIGRSDVKSTADMMISDYIDPSLQNLQKNISTKIYRDNDDYFARAIQYFGNTWLTINTNDVAIKYTDDDLKYIQDRILLSNVTDNSELVRKGNTYTFKEQYSGEEPGFSPALHEFMIRAQGAGFTNVIIDSDGTRRRIELLQYHNGKYYAQLTIAPLLRMVDAQSLERKKNSLIIHGARMDGNSKRTDIVIPLDAHGRMLINWVHKNWANSFRHTSLVDLKNLDLTENNITGDLQNILYYGLRDDTGKDMAYFTDAGNLLAEYAKLSSMQQTMLDHCTGYDNSGKILAGITNDEYQEYFTLRSKFYDHVDAFIAAGYFPGIEKRLSEIRTAIGVSTADDYLSNLKQNFDYLSEDRKMYAANISDLKKQYADSFCIIGNTASSTTDLGTMPFERSYPNVGTHANVMNTVLQRDFISPHSWLWGMALAFIVLLMAILFSRRHSDAFWNISGAVSVIAVIAVLMLAMVLFGFYIPLVTSSLFIITEYIAQIIIRFTSSEKEKGFLRQAFSTYLSKEVVNEIVNDPGKLTLGGEDKHITALFTDIRSFSSFSEMVTPTQLVSILNEYLGILSDTILEYGGTIDKYIGDEIVSFFGAPLDLPDHAYRACCAAVRMKQAEKEYNKKHLAAGDIPRELETRVGVNTGNMVVGNMGTSMKMNYTIMGNDVNLASRLEGVNKIYKSWVLVSEQTWNEADSGEHKGELVSRRLDKVRVIGINKPVQLYNILGFRKEMPENELAEIDAFHEALDTYLRKDFAKAGKMFLAADKMIEGGDGAAVVFADRCRGYIENGVPAGWDGVMTMTTK